MKKFFIILICIWANTLLAQHTVTSPNKKIVASFYLDKSGNAFYTISAFGKDVLAPSTLGLVRNDGDFSTGLRLLNASAQKQEKESYTMVNAKKSNITYVANKKIFSLQNSRNQKMDIEFKVSNDGVAFRYVFPESSSDLKTVTKELTTYHFNPDTRGWLQPKAAAKTGWEQTNPSYEEAYLQDVPLGTVSPTGNGFVYPALFKTNDQWLLITEAGSQGDYCATNLTCDSASNVYKVSFPDEREIITGQGLLPVAALTFASPWRIVTVGSLATITESTLGTDLAQPAINMDLSFIKPGKSSWSWIMSKDDYIVYDEQKKYIDFAADMLNRCKLGHKNWLR
jgi:alpha-glucosidase